MNMQGTGQQSMEKQAADLPNNDFKYYMQDVGSLYLGARYSYEEMMENEMVPFKLKSIIEHYIMKDTEAQIHPHEFF